MSARGMFDHLTQAVHISAGMNISFEEAQAIVSDAALREQEYRDAIADIESNVIHFDFKLRTRLEK
jgi:hypothetical protein